MSVFLSMNCCTSWPDKCLCWRMCWKNGGDFISDCLINTAAVKQHVCFLCVFILNHSFQHMACGSGFVWSWHKQSFSLHSSSLWLVYDNHIMEFKVNWVEKYIFHPYYVLHIYIYGFTLPFIILVTVSMMVDLLQ